MPLGPKVLFTRSPTAMAPTKAARRAFSPFSSVVPSSKICVGWKDYTRRGQYTDEPQKLDMGAIYHYGVSSAVTTSSYTGEGTELGCSSIFFQESLASSKPPPSRRLTVPCLTSFAVCLASTGPAVPARD